MLLVLVVLSIWEFQLTLNCALTVIMIVLFLYPLSFWVSALTLPFSFSTLDSLLSSYFSVVKPKLEYSCIVGIQLPLLMLKTLSVFRASLQLFAISDSFTQTVMAIIMLIFFTFLIYALCMTGNINLMQFLLLFFFFWKRVLNLIHLPWT